MNKMFSEPVYQIMEKKTRYILAGVGAVGMWLLGVAIYLHYCTIGNIGWFKFPFYESTPLVEFVRYKGKLLYFGLCEQAVDVDLNHNNLIIVTNYSTKTVSYDTKNGHFVPNEKRWDYARAGKGNHLYDDWCIKDYYNVSNPDYAAEWRQRALEY